MTTLNIGQNSSKPAAYLNELPSRIQNFAAYLNEVRSRIRKIDLTKRSRLHKRYAVGISVAST